MSKICEEIELESIMNSIHNVDCLEFMKQVPDNYFTLTFTSPPYNMRLRVRNGEYSERENGEHFSKKYKNFSDCLNIEEFYNFHLSALKEAVRISDVVLYNFQPVTGSKEAFFKIIGEMSEYIKDVVVWDKGYGEPSMNEGILNASHELILVLEGNAKKGRTIHNHKFNRGELSNVWRVGKARSIDSSHSASMPEKLVEIAIRNFSNKGDSIFDPFMGTGTTAIVAKSLDRNWCGCELEADYVAIANKRLEKVQGSLF